MDDLTAVVAAAGSGQRMGGELRKQYLPLAGRPILARTLDALWQTGLLQGIILVVAPGEEEYCRAQLVEGWGLAGVQAIVPGGKRRQDSVAAGLAALPAGARWVVVHDGVRPFVSRDLLERVILAGQRHGAALAACPLVDTVKVVDEHGLVLQTPDRESLRAVQTPQAFRRDWLEEAYRRGAVSGWETTDDAALLERCGYPVYAVAGERGNIKITTPEDMALAEAILERGSGHAGGMRV